MADIILGCDSNANNEKWQNTVAKGLENAGHSVKKLDIVSYAFGDSGYKSEVKGKIGIYLMAASLVSVTDLASSGWLYDYTYFIIRGDVSNLIKSENDMNTKGIPKDHDGGCTNKYCDKWENKTYNEINSIVKDKGMCLFAANPDDAVTVLLNAMEGIVPNSNQNTDSGDDEEEWDDKDNFTPHKGQIMQIKPYKEFSSISFDKSYDSPTGTGSVEVLFKSKDYRFIYKGVAMKLKLRRTCDAQWQHTWIDNKKYLKYDENEIFFKEHIPTNELLKELGLPNYRIQRGLMQTFTNDDETDENDGSKWHLDDRELQELSPSQASDLAKQTKRYDAETIGKLKKIAKET